MRTRGLAAVALAALLCACAKAGRSNAVWLVVTNGTGRPLHDFRLEHGRGAFRWALFDKDLTFGDWAKVPEPKTLSLSYTDADGSRRTLALEKPLTPDMIGGVCKITLGPDGKAALDFTPSRRPPPGAMERFWEYSNALAALLVLLLLPTAADLFRRFKSAVSSFPAAIKTALSNPALEGAAAALKLVSKDCPVPMFTMSADAPARWREGTLDGSMLGLLDSGIIWLGGVDEETLLEFRRGADGVFQGSDLAECRDLSLLKDAAAARELARLSAAVTSVGILADAVCARLEWRKASPEGVVSDARALSALKERVESFDPPLVRAILRGNESAALSLISGGADLEALTFGHLNAMTAAAASGRASLIKALLAAGARAQPEYGYPLHAAARSGRADAVRALLEAGVPVDSLEASDTALMEAASRGAEEVVDYLLGKGADPKHRNHDGATALGFARSGKHAKIVEKLLAAGAQ